MTFVLDLLVFLHLIGMASLFGGLFTQVKANPRVVNNAMFHGILTQLVTGLAMLGLLEPGAVPGEGPVDHAKIGVKLVVALVVAVLVVLNRRKSEISGGVYGALIGLTTLNIAVAVFWH